MLKELVLSWRLHLQPKLKFKTPDLPRTSQTKKLKRKTDKVMKKRSVLQPCNQRDRFKSVVGVTAKPNTAWKCKC